MVPFLACVGVTRKTVSLSQFPTRPPSLIADTRCLARDRLSPGENNEPPQDVLPGVKADLQIKALADAIALHDIKNTAQGDQQTAASGTLEAIEANPKKLAGLRCQIQLAADQAWPWRTAGVATIRKDFLLPADRPLTD
jgi:hypothetical protein